MAEVICEECGSRVDDVVCRSCYDGKIKEIDNLEDEIASLRRDIERKDNELCELDNKVSELQSQLDKNQ